jgi:hypothetical protein
MIPADKRKPRQDVCVLLEVFFPSEFRNELIGCRYLAETILRRIVLARREKQTDSLQSVSKVVFRLEIPGNAVDGQHQ